MYNSPTGITEQTIQLPELSPYRIRQSTSIANLEQSRTIDNDYDNKM
mgnify:CR=1 FL=1